MAVITYEKLIASLVERGNNILLKILHGTSKPGRPPLPPPRLITLTLAGVRVAHRVLPRPSSGPEGAVIREGGRPLTRSSARASGGLISCRWNGPGFIRGEIALSGEAI